MLSVPAIKVQQVQYLLRDHQTDNNYIRNLLWSVAFKLNVNLYITRPTEEDRQVEFV